MLYLLLLFARAEENQGTLEKIQRIAIKFDNVRETLRKWVDVIEDSKILNLVHSARSKIVKWRREYLDEHEKIWEDHKRTTRKVLEEWRNNPTNPSEQKNAADGELPGQKDNSKGKKEFIPEML